MPRFLPPTPKQLRIELPRSRPISVDLEKEIIHGYVLAQEGPFKSEGRGEFDRAGLQEIVRLTNLERKGLRSRFTHPGLSADGLGKFLGRAKGAWLDTSGDIWRARADLHISPTSHDTPSGDLGGYVLKLASEDSDALSTSLVIDADEEYRLNKDGTRMKDQDGNPLPPIWKPNKLWATDVVDTGDAVDGMLSIQHLSTGDLPDALQRQGWAILDQLFRGQSAEVVQGRVGEFLMRYLARTYPESTPMSPKPKQSATPEVRAESLAVPALSTSSVASSPITSPTPPAAKPSCPKLAHAKLQAEQHRQKMLDLLRQRA